MNSYYTFIIFGLFLLFLNPTISYPVYQNKRHRQNYPMLRVDSFQTPSEIYDYWQQDFLFGEGKLSI